VAFQFRNTGTAGGSGEKAKTWASAETERGFRPKFVEGGWSRRWGGHRLGARRSARKREKKARDDETRGTKTGDPAQLGDGTKIGLEGQGEDERILYRVGEDLYPSGKKISLLSMGKGGKEIRVSGRRERLALSSKREERRAERRPGLGLLPRTFVLEKGPS